MFLYDHRPYSARLWNNHIGWRRPHRPTSLPTCPQRHWVSSQEASIFQGLTVENNILAVLEMVEKSKERREAVLEALLAEFSISHLRRTPSMALSGGERRRVEIARALASRPHFILLDEPLAGIDPIAVSDIRDLISHLKDRGIGVLITDHNVRDTLGIIDRAYIIHDGMVLLEGSPSDIVGNEDVRRVYLGDRFNL